MCFKEDQKVEFKRIGTTTTTRGRSAEDHKPDRIVNDECDDQSPTYSRDWFVADIYYTT